MHPPFRARHAHLPRRARSALLVVAALAAAGSTASPDIGRSPGATLAAFAPASTSTTSSTTSTSTIAPSATAPAPPATEAPAPPATEAPAVTLPPTPPPPPAAPPEPPPAPAPPPEPSAGSAQVAPGGTAAPDQAARALRLLNSWRQQNGLAPLAVASDAQAKAQAHAERMAAQQRLSHTNLQSGLESWNRWAENVGVGVSPDQVQQMFQDSSSHNGNMLSPDMTNVGVGAAWGADANLYVCQIFVG